MDSEIPAPKWDPPKHRHAPGRCYTDGYNGYRCGLSTRDPEPPDAMRKLYDRIESWQRGFYAKAATGSHGSVDYYRDAAAGLGIALQEIDRQRYDETSGEIWRAYQALLKAPVSEVTDETREAKALGRSAVWEWRLGDEDGW